VQARATERMRRLTRRQVGGRTRRRTAADRVSNKAVTETRSTSQRLITKQTQIQLERRQTHDFTKQ
jgi:hypothetical protein